MARCIVVGSSSLIVAVGVAGMDVYFFARDPELISEDSIESPPSRWKQKPSAGMKVDCDKTNWHEQTSRRIHFEVTKGHRWGVFLLFFIDWWRDYVRSHLAAGALACGWEEAKEEGWKRSPNWLWHPWRTVARVQKENRFHRSCCHVE